jgi:uncharacterized protein (TIGR02118 family)
VRMIRVNVIYPNNPDSTFDMDYYLTKHMPVVREKLGAALQGMTVDQALSGGQPGTDASFRVITGLLFDSVDAFERAFTPFAGEITADIPRFTNIVPVVQVSEVKM